jgi:inorganic phosphate transporter, PiT family
MMIALLILLALLAFANGANDNSKGVATLVGYGVATPRQALRWATLTTALGAVFSFWFAGGLVKSFSTGLFAKGTALTPPLFVAVLVGACGWVLLATRTGLPVSTTHAITGALTGAGLVAFGSAKFEWAFLGTKFALPLAVSPLLSLTLVYLFASPVVLLTAWYSRRCACVIVTPGAQPEAAGATAASLEAARLSVVVDETVNCERQPIVAAVQGSSALTGLHWLTSGMIGFARGWNDAPKIAALGVVVLPGARGMADSFGIVAAAMALGGLLAGRSVLETLAKKVTALPLPEALTASATTAAMVSLASWNGLPVSTTHVSTGAIIGAGVRNDPCAVHWGKVGEILLSWVVTLPVAALLAAAVMAVLRSVT